MTCPPDLLGALVALFADAVAVRLGAARSESYTSLDLPPRCTRRRFREECRRIPEARKHGAVWVVPRSAWEAHRTRRRGVVLPSPAPAVPSTLDARATELLSRAGLRVVRGTR